jgi:hypothetical protein
MHTNNEIAHKIKKLLTIKDRSFLDVVLVIWRVAESNFVGIPV